MHITHSTFITSIGILALATGSGLASAEPNAAAEPIPVTPEALAGIWSVDGLPWILHQFGPDGTFVADYHGFLDTYPALSGSFELDGNEVIITLSRGCEEGRVIRVDDIPEDGRVMATYVSGGGCGIPAGAPWNLTRLSPMSAAASAIVEPVSVFDSPVELSPKLVEGIWLREGTGQLVSFHGAGYSVDDGGVLATAPDDAGRFEIDGDTIVMSSDGSGSCEADGTVSATAAILDSVKFSEEDELYTWRLRFTTPDAECLGWTAGEATWIRVSP